MKKCPKCGQEVESTFCPDCGINVAEPPKCPKCGATMTSRFCPDCGYDAETKKTPQEKKPNGFVEKVKDIFNKCKTYFFANTKKCVVCGVSIILAITLAIILIVNLTNIFRVGKVSKIHIGMSESEVEKILGEPTHIEDGIWYWEENKVSKKIEKAEKILEESFESSNELEIEKAIEKYDEIYAEIEEMTYKFIMVKFDSDGKVREIFLDKKHKYDEENDYSTEAKEVKEATLNINSLEGYEIITNGVSKYNITSNNTSIPYSVKFKDGSYYSNTIYQSSLEVTPSKTSANVTISWQDTHDLGKYTTEKPITSSGTIEDGILINWKTDGENLTLPEGVTGLHSNFKANTTIKQITIPEGTTEIKAGVFAGYVALEYVEIPNSVTSIESSAFSGCTSLTSVTIPNSVKTIGENAFYNCTSLTSITIPNSVTSIGNGAFWDCTSLTEINFNATAMDDLENSNYVFYNVGKSGDGIKVTIGKSVTKIPAYLFYPYHSYSSSTKIKSVVFEEGSVCESIGSSAFEDCISLTSVTIPDSVTLIESGAFYNCTSLTSITIPNSVTLIESGAFYNCTSLTSVTIGNSVTSIESSAFSGCTSLTSITIPDSVTSIESQAFRDCHSLTSITIPNSVTSIGSGAFDGCYKLVEVYNLSSLDITVGFSIDNGYVGVYAKVIHTSLDEPSILEIVDDYIFMTWEGKYYLMAYVGNETEIILPENYKGNNYEMYYRAFYNRDDITKVTIPNSITSIGDSAFYSCDSLTSVTIGNSVTEIGDSAFYDCDSLKYNEYDNAYYLGNDTNPYVVLIKAKDNSISSCVINENTKVIYSNAFAYCDSLTSITIGDGVTSIGGYAFFDCDSLTSVTIPDGVTSIGSSAFFSCDSLTSVTIGDSVTLIGYGAFEDCTSLTSVNYLGTIEQWCNISFSDAFANPLCYGGKLYLNGTLVTNLVISNTVTQIKNYAFYNCTSLRRIIIPNSVTSIGSYVFWGCNSLTIYCEAESKPSGWSPYWNYLNRPVVWGYKG